MSVNFNDLSYCSLYGTTRVVRPFQVNDDVTSGSLTLSGTLGAGASTTSYLTFEYGIPYNPAVPGDPDANGITEETYIPNPSIAAYVSSSTAPNTAGRRFLVGSNPRPLTVASTGGNLNLNIECFQNTATAASPTTFYIQFTLSNPYGVSVTITSTTIECVAYGFSSS